MKPPTRYIVQRSRRGLPAPLSRSEDRFADIEYHTVTDEDETVFLGMLYAAHQQFMYDNGPDTKPHALLLRADVFIALCAHHSRKLNEALTLPLPSDARRDGEVTAVVVPDQTTAAIVVGPPDKEAFRALYPEEAP